MTVAAPVRYMTASVMSLTVEGRPIGERLSLTFLVKRRVDGARRDSVHAVAVLGSAIDGLLR